MKSIHFLLLSFTLIFLTGCSAVETIFKAGMWWAFILIFGVIAIIGWLFFKKKK